MHDQQRDQHGGPAKTDSVISPPPARNPRAAREASLAHLLATGGFLAGILLNLALPLYDAVPIAVLVLGMTGAGSAYGLWVYARHRGENPEAAFQGAQAAIFGVSQPVIMAVLFVLIITYLLAYLVPLFALAAALIAAAAVYKGKRFRYPLIGRLAPALVGESGDCQSDSQSHGSEPASSDRS